MKSTEPKPASDVVATALRRVLKPLIRFMLSQGVTYPYLIRLQKELFVEVASCELNGQHKNRSDNKISLLTGVSRVEVNRLRKQPVVNAAAPANVSFGLRLVSHWISQRDYLDDQNRPLPLARSPRRDVTPSFETLVASAGIDIPPSAVLDEWLRLGVVGIDANDCVRLNTEAFVPQRGFAEKAFFLGENLHDHIAACANNMQDDGTPLLERSVRYNHLTPALIDELAVLSTALTMKALLSVNRRAMELAEVDSNKPQAVLRMNFGAYFYSTNP